MKHVALIAVSALALGLAGCGRPSDSTATDTASTSTIDTTASTSADMSGATSGDAMVTGAQGFANAAASSDAFEIATSKLAATNAASAKVKHFAEQMIKAHTESTAKLKTAAAAAKPAITPSPALSPVQQQAVDALSKEKGASFDKAYANAQIAAHTQTLDTLKTYATAGDVPSLKTFANAMVPTVTAHLNMAKGL